MSATPHPTTIDAVEFLRRHTAGWPADSFAQLVAIEPDGKTIAQSVPAGEVDKFAAFVERHSGTRNIYYQINPLRRAMRKKATKADILGLAYVHADIDPQAGKSLAAERERIRTLVVNFDPPFHAIVDSGGGYNVLWRLDHIVTGEPADLERYALGLRNRLGGDAAFNLDRLLRLPGTMNLPNAKKRKAGRAPAPARVVRLRDGCVTLDDLAFLLDDDEPDALPIPDALPEVDVDALPIPDALRELIKTGGTGTDRSASLFSAVRGLIAAGVDEAAIFAVCLDPTHKISAHPLDQADPPRAVARCIAKVRGGFIERFNQAHAFIMVSGRARIVTEHVDPATGHVDLAFSSVADMKARYSNRLVRIGKDEINPISLWMRSKQRREYPAGVTFAPGVDAPGYLNLWRGWAVAPKRGDWSLMRAHVRDVIADGDEYSAAWILDFMRDACQNPTERPGVAFAMRGPQGCGKGIFANAFGAIFGPHYKPVSDPRHVTGNFNKHLADCLLLFADESFFAGDPRHVGSLKALITEPLRAIEPKGIDPIFMRNYVRVIAASNSDWVVPAGLEERRWACFDVSDKRIGDTKYFARVVDQMRNGGTAAMLYDLLNEPITVALRTLPDTAALLEQKIHSMTPVQRFWYGRLIAGAQLPSADEWQTLVPCYDVQVAFLEEARDEGTTRRSVETILGTELAKLIPKLRKVKRTVPGKYKGRRVPCYAFPPLGECRAAFDRLTRTTNKWPDTRGVVTRLPGWDGDDGEVMF